MTDLEATIHFWEQTLFYHQYLLDPSTIYLIEATIRLLKEQKQIKEENK